MNNTTCRLLALGFFLCTGLQNYAQDSTHPVIPGRRLDSVPSRMPDTLPVRQSDSMPADSKSKTDTLPVGQPGSLPVGSNSKTDTLPPIPSTRRDSVIYPRYGDPLHTNDSLHTGQTSIRPPADTAQPPFPRRTDSLRSGISSGRRTGAGRQGGGRSSAPIGHFYGKVQDGKSNKGLDGTSVQLVMTVYDPATQSRRDSVIRGAITPSNGDFSFENLPVAASYHLRLTAIGYKPVDQRITFDLKLAQNGDMDQRMGAVDKDLGNIKMQADPTQLQQVTVTAEKPLIQLGIDRKIYNVEKDISAPGGTAVDIMKNIPSLAVDIDGNVTLRNASPTIFVDGRPTTLTLDQIPGDEIESVEIITNPGAKFDASGGVSGILNIVMKKNRKPGYNGALRAGVDKRGGYNGGGNLNVKEGKVNVFLSGNYSHRKTISPGTTDRLTFISDPAFQLHQADSNVNSSHFFFLRLGMDYFLDNRNTLSASGTLVHGTSSPYTNSQLTQDTLYNGGYSGESFTRRLSNTNSNFNNRSGMLSFKHNFPRSGEEFTADANYTNGKTTSVNQTISDLYKIPDGPLSSIYQQQQNASGKNEFITGQADFTNPFNEKSKLEAGARVSVRNISNLNHFNTIDSSGQLVYQPLLSSDYNYHDEVLAGYVQYSGALGNLGFQFGLRAENSNYRGTNRFAENDQANPGGLKDTVGSFHNNYPVSLFPSVYLSQKLSANQDLQLNYTRKIDRPGFLQLTPFTDYSDSLNLSRGNPNLKPQFTNSLEMAYQLNYKKNTFLASVYYKYTTDLITRYQTKEINPLTDSLVLINTFINANSSYIGGLELIGRNSLTAWWDLTTNFNVFTSKINAADSIETASARYSWFAKMNMTFKIPKNFTLQLTGDYTSKTVLPPGGSSGNGGGGGGGGGRGGGGGTVSGNAQGYSLPTGGMDASLKYEFLKNKAASLTFSINDIFSTRRSDVFINSAYSSQHSLRFRDPQFFRLQFNYRFGKTDISLFKRKNNREDPDNPQNGSDSPVN